jgi:hypothetical protein
MEIIRRYSDANIDLSHHVELNQRQFTNLPPIFAKITNLPSILIPFTNLPSEGLKLFLLLQRPIESFALGSVATGNHIILLVIILLQI